MRAAKILAGCTYGPEALKIIGKAFEDAWADIAEHFAGDADRAAAARERLAHLGHPRCPSQRDEC